MPWVSRADSSMILLLGVPTHLLPPTRIPLLLACVVRSEDIGLRLKCGCLGLEQLLAADLESCLENNQQQSIIDSMLFDESMENMDLPPLLKFNPQVPP